jgi:hypothetical protein
MGCDGTEECPARKNIDIPCWEFVKEIDDYRRIFDICIDCIVYIIKKEKCTLSEVEIKNIMKKKNICVLE